VTKVRDILHQTYLHYMITQARSHTYLMFTFRLKNYDGFFFITSNNVYEKQQEY